MLQKLTLFVTTKKISFYTNWRIQDAGVQSEKGSKGGREEVADPCHQKGCALIFKKQIFLTSV